MYREGLAYQICKTRQKVDEAEEGLGREMRIQDQLWETDQMGYSFAVI